MKEGIQIKEVRNNCRAETRGEK